MIRLRLWLRRTSPAAKVFLAASIIFQLTGCKTGTRAQNRYDRSTVDLTPVDGGTYVEASIGDATYLNPILATDSASNDINAQVYNGLVKYDKDIKLVGDLAEGWDLTNEGKTITFHLRKNVKWHDGRPFTSADVMFTYQTLISSNTRTAFSSDYLLVSKAEAPDPFTFRVSYNDPFAPAIESWGMGILPKHIWENGDVHTHEANRHPIGTGPYIFKEWLPSEKIVLEANPDYFEGRPHFDRYVYRIIPDQSVQFLELRQGTLATMALSPDQYNGYDEFFLQYDKYQYPAFKYDFFAFNLKNDLFKDKRVRQAISYAINKEDIVQGVYQGLASPASGPFPPASWAYNPDVKPYPHDVAKAKALLAEAGWKDSDGDGLLDRKGTPFKFTVITNQGNKVRESIAQVVQNSLSQVGIKMEIRIIEWSVFIHSFVDKKQFEAIILGWNLARDPDAFSMWHSSQQGPNQYNFISYTNPNVDRLLEEGRRTFNIEKRAEIYHRMHVLIAEDAPYVFLDYPSSLPVIHKRIVGVEKAPAGLGWNFKDWFVPREWQKKHELAS